MTVVEPALIPETKPLDETVATDVLAVDHETAWLVALDGAMVAEN